MSFRSGVRVYIVVSALLMIGLTIALIVLLFDRATDASGTVVIGDKQIDPFADTGRAAIVRWLKGNTAQVQDMQVPKSYDVVPGYYDTVIGFRDTDFEAFSAAQRYDAIVAMSNQMNGTSTYDAAVWTVCVAKHFTTDHTYWVDQAYKWMRYLAYGEAYGPQTYERLIAPRDTNNTEWSYLGTPQAWPKRLNTTTQPDTDLIGTIGYTFRNLPLQGFFAFVDPRARSVDNTIGGQGDYAKNSLTQKDGYELVSQLYITWSDYRPVTGEAAWTLLGAVTLMEDELIYGNETKRTVIRLLCERLVRTMLVLEADKLEKGGEGGILAYSPQSVAGTAAWDTAAFSIENMASATAALVAFHTSTHMHADLESVLKSELQVQAKNFANRIGNRAKKHVHFISFEYDSNHSGLSTTVIGTSIDQGGKFSMEDSNRYAPMEDSNRLPQFAVDCFTWGISAWGSVFEADKADTCFDLWTTVKKYGGYHNADGNVAGFGYSFRDETENVFSAEWTVGGLFAIETMLILYKEDAAKMEVLKNDRDLIVTELKAGITTNTTAGGAGLLYCNKAAYQIPFGWIGCAQPAMASTGWWLYWLDQRNPWRLDGTFNAVLDPM